MGFGIGALLLIVSIFSFVWGFLPKKSNQMLREQYLLGNRGILDACILHIDSKPDLAENDRA